MSCEVQGWTAILPINLVVTATFLGGSKNWLQMVHLRPKLYVKRCKFHFFASFCRISSWNMCREKSCRGISPVAGCVRWPYSSPASVARVSARFAACWKSGKIFFLKPASLCFLFREKSDVGARIQSAQQSAAWRRPSYVQLTFSARPRQPSSRATSDNSTSAMENAS